MQVTNGIAAVIGVPLIKSFVWASCPPMLLTPFYLFFMAHGARDEGIRLL